APYCVLTVLPGRARRRSCENSAPGSALKPSRAVVAAAPRKERRSNGEFLLRLDGMQVPPEGWSMMFEITVMLSMRLRLQGTACCALPGDTTISVETKGTPGCAPTPRPS